MQVFFLFFFCFGPSGLAKTVFRANYFLITGFPFQLFIDPNQGLFQCLNGS
jgi:hypothetical protein